MPGKESMPDKESQEKLFQLFDFVEGKALHEQSAEYKTKIASFIRELMYSRDKYEEYDNSVAPKIELVKLILFSKIQAYRTHITQEGLTTKSASIAENLFKEFDDFCISFPASKVKTHYDNLASNKVGQTQIYSFITEQIVEVLPEPYNTIKYNHITFPKLDAIGEHITNSITPSIQTAQKNLQDLISSPQKPVDYKERVETIASAIYEEKFKQEFFKEGKENDITTRLYNKEGMSFLVKDIEKFIDKERKNQNKDNFVSTKRKVSMFIQSAFETINTYLKINNKSLNTKKHAAQILSNVKIKIEEASKVKGNNIPAQGSPTYKGKN